MCVSALFLDALNYSQIRIHNHMVVHTQEIIHHSCDAGAVESVSWAQELDLLHSWHFFEDQEISNVTHRFPGGGGGGGCVQLIDNLTVALLVIATFEKL